MTARIALFDLGNVVVDWRPARLYEKRFGDAEAAARFLTEIDAMNWHKKHDSGTPMDETIPALSEAFPQYADHIRAWQTEWMEMFEGYVPGVPQLIGRLEAAETPLYALSNMATETAGPIFDRFRIINVFRDIVVSGDHGVIKPDREIYDITLARMGHPDPSDVLFIDDRRDNIEAAETLGFHGHVFTDAAGLERALLDHQLIAP